MITFFDVSVLGAGYCNPLSRTGIFRVVENIALGLAKPNESNECELNFCATHSFQYLSATVEYLQSNAQLQQVPFPHSLQKRRLDSYVHKLNCQIPGASIHQKLLLRVLRKASITLNKVIEPYFNLINSKSISGADIFHSPFFPIPPQVQALDRIQKFITVYDLIPVLFPQFFEFKEDHLLKDILKSIGSSDWVLCISQSTKNDLCNHLSLDPSRVFVTHLAASELFYPCPGSSAIDIIKQNYGIPDAPYILSLSTLEPRKNIDHTIRCFVKLVQQESIQDLNLVLVGTKGWDYSKIFDEISANTTLRDRIIITGYVADEDLAPLYSGAMMFVYPSLYEGFGLPPLEAMQCGVPVITSNTSSLPEVVGDAGIMVDPLGSDALCQNMLNLYQHSSLRESMSLKSIERAKLFSWQKCTQETIRAYQVALDS